MFNIVMQEAFGRLILTIEIFGASVLCIVGTSILILFSDQLNVVIMVIIVEVIFFVVLHLRPPAPYSYLVAV